MKLLPESPVEFLDPLSGTPDHITVTELKTPFGSFVMASSGEALMRAEMHTPLPAFIQDLREEWDTDIRIDAAPFREVIRQLEYYFSGKLVQIRAVVQPLTESVFTRAVHELLARIPYGETLTYREMAEETGNSRAARAVGGACGRNPVLIIVPCHRVVAAHGLGGFGGGLELKKRLLELEKKD
jgi:methylated-DNA-[protein]-cysteine S-methyltransferase